MLEYKWMYIFSIFIIFTRKLNKIMSTVWRNFMPEMTKTVLKFNIVG